MQGFWGVREGGASGLVDGVASLICGDCHPKAFFAADERASHVIGWSGSLRGAGPRPSLPVALLPIEPLLDTGLHTIAGRPYDATVIVTGSLASSDRMRGYGEQSKRCSPGSRARRRVAFWPIRWCGFIARQSDRIQNMGRFLWG